MTLKVTSKKIRRILVEDLWVEDLWGEDLWGEDLWGEDLWGEDLRRDLTEVNVRKADQLR